VKDLEAMSSSPLKVEQAAKAQEPSMEEILASIRKIISDDDKPAAPPPPPPPPALPPPPPEEEAQGQDDIDALLAGFDAEDADPEVLELTEAMVAGDEETVDADLDFVDADAPPSEAPAAPPEPPRAAARPAPQPAATFDERLISTATDSAIASAFGTLTHTVLSQNARTLDDLVQDMLRPMLKAWLDDNLPPLVERLVRAEIERVSRGRH
jgi:uncharacterized protein